VSFVVDASVALKWFLADEPGTERARAIVEADVALVAPDLLIVEVCNAAWRAARLGRLGRAQVGEIAAVLPQFFDALSSAVPFAPRAVAIAGEIDHPVYDCLYVALAEAQQTPLITADDALLRRLLGTPWQDRVVGLADFKPQG
jgi:predicted nucleic acid-binding protein